MTNQSRYQTGAVTLTGLPKGIYSASLSAFFFTLFEHQPSQFKNGVEILSINNHARSSSAVVRIPRGKKSFDQFVNLLSSTPFQGSNIRVGRANTVLATQQTVVTYTFSREVYLVQETRNEKYIYLARSFHQYLLHQPEFVSGAVARQLGSDAFSVFYQSVKETCVIDELAISEKVVEGNVFSKLYSLRLVRLLRRTTTVTREVIMLIKNQAGEFPTPQVSQAALTSLRVTQAQDTQNKGGVVIQEKGSKMTINLNEVYSFYLRVELSDHNDSVDLEQVKLIQSKGRWFKLLPLQLPLSISQGIDVAFEISVGRIGIYRETAVFYFRSKTNGETFRIARFLSASANDEVMVKLLAPTVPYERKKINFFTAMPDKVFHSPKLELDQCGTNPFGNLQQHSIPRDVFHLLRSREFENVIEKPEEASGVGYGKFWKDLLWAAEFQNNIDVQLYDMNDVTLRKEGHTLRLHVPGLAESRPSVLRGDLVHVTWNNRLYKGRVSQVKLLEAALEFHPSFHSSYNPSVDRVNVRFTFSRMTFRTSHEGSITAESIMGRQFLFPTPEDVFELWASRNEHDPSSSRNKKCVWANRGLNEEQQAAVLSIVQGALRPLPYLIWGPPGTGKTTTIVEAVYQLAVRQKRVLLVAPSNDAADVLVERLAPYFPNSEMRRILAYSRSLDTMVASIQQYAKDGLSSEEQVKDILSPNIKIVVSTVNLAARFSYIGVSRGHFDVLCVDEAGHATEPEIVAVAATLIDFSRGSSGQVILAGDPKQLGPIITSPICRSSGMSKSYLERLMERTLFGKNDEGVYPPYLLTKLVQNYRSHPSILKLPNIMFYDGDLKCCGDFMMTHNLCKWEHLPSPGFPIMFHSMEGDNLREEHSPSWFNPHEAQQVVEYVKLLLLETRPPLKPEEIGIITPYSRQAQKIRQALAAAFRTTEDRNGGIVGSIKVGSVETFQGQERRVIILSTVRSDPEQVGTDIRHNLGFVANAKRFNVAVTRAKSLLIVVGCAPVLALDSESWLPFLRYCHARGSWVGDEWDPTEAELEAAARKSEAIVNDDDTAMAVTGPHSDDSVDDWMAVSAEENPMAALHHEE